MPHVRIAIAPMYWIGSVPAPSLAVDSPYVSIMCSLSTYTYTYTYSNTHAYACIYIYTYTYTSTYAHIYKYKYIYTYYTNTYTYTYAYIYTNINIYTTKEAKFENKDSSLFLELVCYFKVFFCLCFYCISRPCKLSIAISQFRLFSS